MDPVVVLDASSKAARRRRGTKMPPVTATAAEKATAPRRGSGFVRMLSLRRGASQKNVDEQQPTTSTAAEVQRKNSSRACVVLEEPLEPVTLPGEEPQESRQQEEEEEKDEPEVLQVEIDTRYIEEAIDEVRAEQEQEKAMYDIDKTLSEIEPALVSFASSYLIRPSEDLIKAYDDTSAGLWESMSHSLDDGGACASFSFDHCGGDAKASSGGPDHKEDIPMIYPDYVATKFEEYGEDPIPVLLQSPTTNMDVFSLDGEEETAEDDDNDGETKNDNETTTIERFTRGLEIVLTLPEI